MLLLVTTCQSAPTPDAGPIGQAEYEARISALTGGPVTFGQLLARSRQAHADIAARLDRLARQVASDGSTPVASWQTVFETLRQDHPGEVATVLNSYRQEITRSANFVDAKALVTLPTDPLEVVEVGNLALRSVFPLALYLDGKLAVTTSASLASDPAYLANHCRVCIPPLAVHEGYPGHHVAFYHLALAAPAGGAAPSDDPRPLVARHNRLFVEGWGLYAELLMIEQGYYATPAELLGAWRMLLLRALRAAVDAELHTGTISPAAAIELYRSELLMSEEAAATEVRRHLAEPTMKASYFVGLLQLLELRAALRRRPDFAWRDFHDRLLAQPEPATLTSIARHRFGVELGPPAAADLVWPWSDGDPPSQ